MPGTISLEEGNATVNRIRGVLMEFPEVITATSQQGRPDDGTDSAGFFNAEFFLPLKPPQQWTTAPNRDGLVHAMQARLSSQFVGVEFSYSQAISDNVQEAASGVKGANAIKVFGPELDIIARKAEEIRRMMAGVAGRRRPRGLPLARPADRRGADRPGPGGPLRPGDRRRQRGGAGGDRRARGRAAVRARRRPQLPHRGAARHALPRQHGEHRPHPGRRPARRDPGRRGGDPSRLRRLLHLPRGCLALRAHPLQRARPRPGQHRGGGAGAGGGAGRAAARLPARLGGRVPQPAGGHRPAAGGGAGGARR